MASLFTTSYGNGVMPIFFLTIFTCSQIQPQKLSTCIHQLCSYPTEEPKVYSEDKKTAHKQRFDEVKEQKKKNFTTPYGPLFKKSKHPLAIMVR